MVVDGSGEARPFAEVSPIMQSLNSAITVRRIHVKQQWKALVEQAIAKVGS
jgi:hypothetical protein